MREIPWIARRPEQPRLGGRHQAEFRARALAEDGHAGVEETMDEGAGMIRDIVLEDAGARGGPRTLEKIQVLEQERHAAEGAVRKPPVDLRSRVLVVFYDDGIDLRIDLVCARDGFVQQLVRTDLFGPDEIGEAEPVMAAVFLDGHDGISAR